MQIIFEICIHIHFYNNNNINIFITDIYNITLVNIIVILR